MIPVMVLLAGIFTAGKISASVENLEVRAYKISHDLTVPGKPEEIFDALSGDISGWWDHSFSEKPRALYIEPKPGGAFMEIFDDAGNGVKHATVIAADRGKLLRFEGPLGLSGRAVQLISSYELTAAGPDSTHIKFELHGSGELNDKLIKIVDGVWYHFLFEQFKPYIETQNQKK
jgi:hypothetical protein